MRLEWLGPELAVCRLPAAAAIPDWAASGPFACAARTDRELSMVVPIDAPPPPGARPPDLRVQAPWRAFRVAGTLPFNLVGVVASLTRPLADAGIPVFVVSTFDTDYVLVGSDHAARAASVLRDAGHDLADPPPRAHPARADD